MISSVSLSWDLVLVVYKRHSPFLISLSHLPYSVYTCYEHFTQCVNHTVCFGVISKLCWLWYGLVFTKQIGGLIIAPAVLNNYPSSNMIKVLVACMTTISLCCKHITFLLWLLSCVAIASGNKSWKATLLTALLSARISLPRIDLIRIDAPQKYTPVMFVEHSWTVWPGNSWLQLAVLYANWTRNTLVTYLWLAM